MSDEDDWVNRAMTDDSLVADTLVGLRRGAAEPADAIRLGWSVRQPRSGAVAASAAARTKRKLKMKAEPNRASPTTPLSWSGGGGGCVGSGGSGGGGGGVTTSGGSEEYAARSKVCVKNEGTTSKRPRKKKTLAELREEETLLLRERKKLRREIETMRINVQNQRATNESLKRMKLGLESKQKLKTVIDSSVCEPCSIVPTTNSLNATLRSCGSSLSHKLTEVEIRESGFSLPDLNLPAEGDLDSSAAFYGIS